MPRASPAARPQDLDGAAVREDDQACPDGDMGASQHPGEGSRMPRSPGLGSDGTRSRWAVGSWETARGARAIVHSAGIPFGQAGKRLESRTWQVREGIQQLHPTGRGLPARHRGSRRSMSRDLRTWSEDMVAERDDVVVRWMAEETQQGELLGIPPTGKQARSSGRASSAWPRGRSQSNGRSGTKLDLMRQLGVMPSPESRGNPSPGQASATHGGATAGATAGAG
jgi:hypothetical protein